MVWISDPLPKDSEVQIPTLRKEDKGTIGTLIKLKANYFRIDFPKKEEDKKIDLSKKKKDKDVTIFHFDVKITDAHSIQIDEILEKDASNVVSSASNSPSESEPSFGKEKNKKKKKNKKMETKNSSAEAERSSAAAIAESAPIALQRWIPKALKRKIFQAYINEYPQIFKDHFIAFDGGVSAYSTSLPAALDSAPKFFNFEDLEQKRTKKYKIEWKYVEQMKLKTLLNHLSESQHMPEKCQTIFQGLEIMFNYDRTQRFATASFNRFFSHDDRLFGPNFVIGQGKEGVRGFFMSLRPCQGWKDEGALLLNLDVSHAVFYRSQPVLDYLKTLPMGSKYFNDYKKPLHQKAIELIQEKLINKNIKVRVEIKKGKGEIYKRDYRVKSVSPENSSTYTFLPDKGKPGIRRSVVEHFKLAHEYDVKWPQLNCLVMSNGAHVPIEVCSIAPKQQSKEKLTSQEQKDFIKNTVSKPIDRLRQIENIFKENKFDEDPVLKSLGVSIDSNLVSADGRVLPPPVVKMSETRVVRVEEGKWTIERNDVFHKPAKLTEWGILNFTSDTEKIGCLRTRLIQVAKLKDMEPSEPLFDEDLSSSSIVGFAKHLKKLKMNYPRLRLIVFLKENNDQAVYDLMKYVCEFELNVANQCVQLDTLKNPSNLLMTNILLKINGKLGHRSHFSLYLEENYPMYGELFKRPVMVMGADVNHPGAGDKTTPSMVAVVASVDRQATRYVNEVRHQTTRRDVIEDMQEITQNLLEQFRADVKCLPERIIMYRDGVSDTQFRAVVARELRAMREACTAFGKEYKPPMTFMCVQKRHHTRLFCDNREDADRSGNAPPGTVVDTVITTHSNRNFFLNSHAGIQGTSKPSHYTVLWDDSDLTMNQLQLLTNSLCYNYARCFRAVSMPSPVFYADRAAYRAKTRLEGRKLLEPQKWEANKDGKYPEELLEETIRIDKTMEASKKMYFI